ncbi:MULTISPECIES: hypothetical protein [unclassified Nocardia]|nr:MULTISPECIES: hypothetical protein [unclassified Nocardia]
MSTTARPRRSTTASPLNVSSSTLMAWLPLTGIETPLPKGSQRTSKVL